MIGNQPAFPVNFRNMDVIEREDPFGEPIPAGKGCQYAGMTMHHYIAIKAMAAFITADRELKLTEKEISILACEQATAMMKELT